MSQLITFLPMIVHCVVAPFSLSWATVASLIAAVFSVSRQRFFIEWASFVHALISFVFLFIMQRVDLLKYGSIFFGLFSSIVAWGSIALKKPLSLQYARLKTPQKFWTSSLFYRVNFVLTAALGLFFFLEGGTKILTISHPALFNYSTVSAVYSISICMFINWFPHWYKNRQLAKS